MQEPRSRADDADHLVAEQALPGGGDDAHRHADDDADDDAQRRHPRRRWKTRLRSDATGWQSRPTCRNRRTAPRRCSCRTARAAACRGQELNPGCLVDCFWRAIADHGQHRVDWHHAADEEGDGEQAEEGERDGEDEEADDADHDAERMIAAAVRWSRSRLAQALQCRVRMPNSALPPVPSSPDAALWHQRRMSTIRHVLYSLPKIPAWTI